MIAVIIPIFNTLPLILEQRFEGMLAQACPIHQIIVIDDGSQAEETLVCLRKYTAQHPKYLTQDEPPWRTCQGMKAGLKLV